MLVGDVFARMGLDSSQYEAGLRQAEKKGNTVGKILRNALSFTIGMGMFQAVKQGFKTIVGEAVSFNGMMEQARIGFATMLGSAERAEVFLRDMADFAAKTPFEFPELLDASKRMLAYGFAAGDVLPMMEAVGNATAALSLGSQGIDRIILALGQMRAKGKLSGEEMRQLTEAGIPAWEMLAEAMGKTTAEIMDMQSKGLIPADRAIKMLVEGMNKRFPDMMKNMENTWEGVTSTIKDVWRMTIGAITKDLFEGTLEWLKRIRDTLSNFYDMFSRMRQAGVDTVTALKIAITQAFGEGVGGAASIIISIVQTIAKVFMKAAVLIRTYWGTISFVLLNVVSALLMFKGVLPVISWFVNLTRILNGTVTATSGLFGFLSRAVAIYRNQLIMADLTGTVAITTFTKIRYAVYALYTALGKLGIVLLIVSGLLAGIFYLWGRYTQSVEKSNMEKLNAKLNASVSGLSNSLDSIGGSATDAADTIDDYGKSVSKSAKKVKKSLAPFDEINRIFQSTADAAGGMGDIDIPGINAPGVPDISAGIPGIDMADLFDFEGAKPTIKGFFEWIWDEWTKTVQGWGWVQGLSDWIVDVFYDAEEGIWRFVRVFENLKKSAREVLLSIWDYVTGTWGNIKTVTSDIWGAIVGFLGEKWEDLKEFGGNIFSILEDLITGKIDLRTAISQIWGEIEQCLGDSWEDIKQLGTEIWTGLEKFLSDQWELTKQTASDIWGSISGFFSETWDDIQTMVEGTAKTIADHLGLNWEDIKTNAETTWNTISNTIQSLWNSLKSNASTTWNNISSTIQNRWNTLKSSAPGVWESIKSSIQSRWNSLKSSASTTWSSIRSTVQNIWSSLKSDAPSVWENIRSSIVGKWNSLKSSATSIWDSIKSTISSSLDSIKSLFNFSWSLPPIKLPRFTVTWSTSGFWGSVGKFLGLPGKPIIDVTWLARGGLITAPMVAGLGEAGREAVIPLDTNTGWADIMADRLVSALQRTQVAGAGVGGDIYVYIGNEQVDAYIHRSQDRRNIRSNGR